MSIENFGHIFKRSAPSRPDSIGKGDLGVLIGKHNCQTSCSEYFMLTGESAGEVKRLFTSSAIQVWPPEAPSKDVEVVCDGKTTIISRESAKALNLI